MTKPRHATGSCSPTIQDITERVRPVSADHRSRSNDQSAHEDSHALLRWLMTRSVDRRPQNPPSDRCSSHPCSPRPPTTESAFHITEFAPNFPGALFPFVENAFRIAKFAAYLLEK
jgi:hypothetical protein